MKFRTHNKKKRVVALITVATLILALLFTACPNAAGGGGGTPTPVYTKVAYGMGGRLPKAAAHRAWALPDCGCITAL